MKTKLAKWLLVISALFTVTSCFEKNKLSTPEVGSAKAEEDCDDAAAKKTMEKIKTEEFSLNSQSDAGCSAEEAKAAKEVKIPAATQD